MTRMKKPAISTHALLVFVWLGLAAPHGLTAVERRHRRSPPRPQPSRPRRADALDRLLAPIALYPDQLLAQMLLCASNPGKVAALGEWLASQTLKGTELQDAATKAGFEPSFVALVLFPQVVEAMAGDVDWTTRLGQAFTADRSAVFASIQRLRVKAQQAGKLKTTPQQEVETRTTSSGQQVVVIEPANPQVVYVPQYNPQTVYTTTSSSTVVVQQESSSDAVAAGLIGFTAGIAIGAAIDNDYYYGPYGWRGGGYMYDDAWDDWDDARDDARDDWQDHREDLADERGDRASNAQDERSDRASNAQEQRSERQQSGQQQRTEAQQTRQQKSPESQAQRDARRSEAQTATGQTRATGTSQEARGYSSNPDRAPRDRSGTKSDAFSGYSSGKSERAASQRGQRSRSSSRGGRQVKCQTTVDDRDADGAHVRDADVARLVHAHGSGSVLSILCHARGRGAGLVDAAKAGALEDVGAIFGPDAKELADSSDAATARRNRDVFMVAAAEKWQLIDQGRAQGARRRQRRVAVSRALGEGRERMAVRHRRGKRGSARQTNRPQRAGGDPNLPHLRSSTAALCRKRTRWTGGGTVCPNVLERSGSRERTLLAREARPDAQSAGRPRGTGRDRGPASW